MIFDISQTCDGAVLLLQLVPRQFPLWLGSRQFEPTFVWKILKEGFLVKISRRHRSLDIWCLDVREWIAKSLISFQQRVLLKMNNLPLSDSLDLGWLRVEFQTEWTTILPSFSLKVSLTRKCRTSCSSVEYPAKTTWNKIKSLQ